jgi:TonB family protein
MLNKFLFTLILALSFSLSIVSGQTPTPGVPKVINGGVINGKALSLPKPEYPPAALAVKASGAVNVQVTIDEEGTVVSAAAVSGHPLLRQAAEQAARQAKFSPTKLSGQPVKVTGVIVYNFVASQAASSNEKKLLIMGLGCFLTIADSIPNDEWESISKDDFLEVPQIAQELTPLTSITGTTSKEKRAEIIKKVTASLENKLSGAGTWQFEFGKQFAGIMIELQKGGTNTDKIIDETALKTKLLKMRDLIFSAQPDFPPDVLVKFKEIVKFADVQNLNADENKSRFVQLLMSTLNTISPNSAK